MSMRQSWAPLLFGLLVYLAIDSFTRLDFGNYNGQVASYVFIAAASLLVIAAFTGRQLALKQPALSIGIAAALSIGWSFWNAPNLYQAADQAKIYYSVILLGISLYLTHRDDDEQTVTYYFAVIALVHMIFLVDTIYWLIYLQSTSQRIVRGLPHFANIRHFAYHGFIAAACATSLFMMSKKLEVTAFILTSASLFGIILLGARGALLAWFVFAVFMWVFQNRRRRFTLFCIASLVIAASAMYFLTETGLLRVSATSLFDRLQSADGSAFRVGDRITIWVDALRTTAARPFFGFGPDGYISSRCCYPWLAQPHNFIVQFLLEFGLIGTTLLMATAWKAVKICGGDFSTLISNLRLDSSLRALCATLIGFLAYALIDGLLYHAIALVHFSLFVALLLATLIRLAHEGGRNSPD